MADTGKKAVPFTLDLQLTGPFRATWSDGRELKLSVERGRAMLAILALAPDMQHSRSWVREVLWSRSPKDQASDSFRQCHAALKAALGDRFEAVVTGDRLDIGLVAALVNVDGDLSRGTLLEGLHVSGDGYTHWKARATAALEQRQRARLTERATALRPCIGIVPFLARTNSESDRHLSDLVAQEVSRALSRNRGFDVISHMSSRRFTGNAVDLDAVRDALGTDYVATGCIASVDPVNGRATGRGFRLDIDFVETATGRLVWSEVMEGALANLLETGSPRWRKSRIASERAYCARRWN